MTLLDTQKYFIAEHLVPSPDTPHFSILFDLHMMCAASGMERSLDEDYDLLQQSCWKYNQTHREK